MRDAVPPCEMRHRGEAGTGRRNIFRRRPGRPRHPARRSRRARPPPTYPGATRADRHGRPPRPTVLNDPSHHTRETHSDASATTLWTRRTRPSRPSPRPSRPTPSKPPLNNLHGSAGLPWTPRNRWAGVPRRHRWHHAEGLTRNGAGGAPGTVLRWGRVQICCKGAPGRDRSREETRNTNVSSRTLRHDPGLCNRFGPTGAARPPRRGRPQVGRRP